MKLGIGIDTGGTYTDAVIYDYEQSRIISSSKALTTKEDLSVGIGNALDGLPSTFLKEASIVSLSTTLATNACVENKGGRAKLLFIGVDNRVVQRVGKKYGFEDNEEIYYLDCECQFDGKILQEPDWDLFLEQSKAWFRDVEAVAIVEIYAMKTSALLEKKAKELITQKYGLPVICGHELFSDLNSIQRGSTTLLNARLLPIIGGFLQAIKKALKLREISAPVVIVRSDGSVMSEEFTCVKPVETLLCGPAASVIGGIELTHEKDCLIIDMGGTTTDVSIVKDQIPLKAENGVNVGNWRTFVKGVYINTFGLGGDSVIRHDHNNRLSLEAFRVVPLSIAASKWPSIKTKLHQLLLTRKQHTLLLHEFFMLVKDISESSSYTQREIDFCNALKNGPLIFSEAADIVGVDMYNFKMDRLEKEGVIIRCGLTPTDIMHIKGDFKEYDIGAAMLGAEFVSACIGVSVQKLCDLVYDSVKKLLYTNLVKLLIEYEYHEYRSTGLGKRLEKLVEVSWENHIKKKKHGFFTFNFSTPASLVGIGAPIHIFLPDVADALGTRFIVPENAGVANAIGAVIGNITAICEIEIKPEGTAYGISGYTVYGKEKNFRKSDKDDAIQMAMEEAKASAKDEAIKRGANGDISIKTEIKIDTAESKDNVEVFLGIKVIATAIGRISI